MTSNTTRYLLIFICSLLIFLFTYTALSKLLAFKTFEATLANSPLIGNKSYLLAWSVPIGELVIAALLLLPKTQLAGLRFSFAVMFLFSIYVAYMILFVPDLPCSCGGIISKLSWTHHLIVNIFFTLLAMAGIILKKDPEIFIRINRTSRTPV